MQRKESRRKGIPMVRFKRCITKYGEDGYVVRHACPFIQNISSGHSVGAIWRCSISKQLINDDGPPTPCHLTYEQRQEVEKLFPR